MRVIKQSNPARVFVLHGVLLLMVLMTAYWSVWSQYSALRDQALERDRSDQQPLTRAVAVAIERHIKLIFSTLHQADTKLFQPDNTADIAHEFLAGLGVMDQAAGRIVQHISGDAQRLTHAIGQGRWAQTITHPQLLVAPTGTGNDIVLAVPIDDGGTYTKKLAVAVLSNEQIAFELAWANARESRAELPSHTFLLRHDGLILSSTAAETPMQSDAYISQIITLHTWRTLGGFIQAGSAGSIIVVEPDDVSRTTLLTVQPIAPVPGIQQLFIVSISDNRPSAVSRQLRPIIWQLTTQASLIVLASVAVLASTWVSLYRGSRSIARVKLEMLNRDLKKARHIQLNWLPAPHYKTPRICIAAENIPAAHISGDFYNWFELPGNQNDGAHKTVIVIGDVSGHGLPAAFLMSTTQMIIKTAMPRLRDPGACLTEVNQQLCTLVYNGQFVTILIAVLDHDNHQLSIASAGQAGPVVRRVDAAGSVHCNSEVIDPQLVVGVDDSMQYITAHVPLTNGDMLLFYTDGAVEMTNAAGVQFGLDRLTEVVRQSSGDADNLLHKTIKSLAAHRGDTEPEDDLTLVAVRLNDVNK
jgi:serine phosphatase RsbU (regulator of sigma subunit)